MLSILSVFWTISFIIVGVQIICIFVHINKNKIDIEDELYSKEVIQKTEVVEDALRRHIVKKHIITNSAEEYNSEKVLLKYKRFLNSPLMQDIIGISEEMYNG